jgi:HEAT repeat protein
MALLLAALAVALAVAVVIALSLRRRRSAATPARADRDLAPEHAAIGWPREFNGAGQLDDDARLRLIEDLGLIAAPWCVSLLMRAYDEETRPTHVRAVLRALGACRDAAARPALERALASADDEARSIAAEALSNL